MKREHLALFALVGFPVVGVCAGAALAFISPPLNPIDFWSDVRFLASSFGVIGLLFGYLVWLWLLDRMPTNFAICAAAIPLTRNGAVRIK